MNFEDIIARAVPPPERVDAAVFEPVGSDPETDRRRHERIAQAFPDGGVAAHAEALGLSPEAWLDRFRDVRLVGAEPDWARTFRVVWERVSDGPLPFAEVRRWTRAEVEAAWPASLPYRPEVLDGLLDFLAGRIGVLFQSLLLMEGSLNSRPTWADRFRRHPALAYAIGRILADWLADLARMVRYAAEDRAALAATYFDGDDPGLLTAVEPGLGDPHAGGRSVAILHFERGSVVFKPKDLRVASAVAEIARPFADAGLVAPTLLTRGDHAWEPVYETNPLSGSDDADAFFSRLGGWLALLQILGANDFWFDNLIAEGAVPRFIDFETAVQPARPGFQAVRTGLGAGDSARIGLAPLGVGILPLLFPTRDGRKPTDLGCLSRPGEFETPLPDLNTGNLVSLIDEKFVPRYPGGDAADAADHFDAFEDGYLRIAHRLADPAFRDHAINTLRKAADAPVRIILIDTWSCYRAIQHSLLPRFLSDGIWRELAIHSIIPRQPEFVGPLREAAAHDLRRLDIPLFQTAVASRGIAGMDGVQVPDFHRLDAISETQGRFRAFAESTEDEKIAWLRSGFSLRHGNPPRRRSRKETAPPADNGNLLAWADDIASEIVRRAIPDDTGMPTWLGLYLDVFTGWRIVGPLGIDVLTGRAGVALALLDLAKGLDRRDLATLAQETLAGAARYYTEHHSFLRRAGAGHVVGAGGLVAALARAPESMPLARNVFDLASSRRIWMDSGSDFVSGLAGWREAARALGEPAPTECGTARPYSPAALPLLVSWLDPDNAEPICVDRTAAARRRRDYDRHGSWFVEDWLDDRHNLSGSFGLPALAVRFVQLAQGVRQADAA